MTKPKFLSKILLILRYCIGIIFLFSAFAKLFDIESSVKFIGQFVSFVGLQVDIFALHILFYILVFVEFGISIALLLRVYLKVLFGLVILMPVVRQAFLLINIISVTLLDVDECICFGSSFELSIHFSIFLNLSYDRSFRH